jgi:hypothetical protein
MIQNFTFLSLESGVNRLELIEFQFQQLNFVKMLSELQFLFENRNSKNYHLKNCINESSLIDRFYMLRVPSPRFKKITEFKEENKQVTFCFFFYNYYI